VTTNLSHFPGFVHVGFSARLFATILARLAAALHLIDPEDFAGDSVSPFAL